MGCHVVPFFWTKTNVNIERTKERFNAGFQMFLSRDRREELEELFLDKPGCSDYSWNMISLSPTLHDWWLRSFWAFKYNGMTPSEGGWQVTIQFHWMPQDASRKLDYKDSADPQPLHPMDFVDWNKNHLAKLETPVHHVKAHNIETNRPILTGDIFTIAFTTAEEAGKFKLMIELQWAIIQISAMSGAAGNPELFD